MKIVISTGCPDIARRPSTTNQKVTPAAANDKLNSQFSKSLFAALDSTGQKAVLEMLRCMAAGLSNEQAIAASNLVLINAGRKPVLLG